MGKRREPTSGSFKKGDPRINRTKPGPGRLPKRFQKWCGKQIMSKQVRRAARRALRDDDHKHFPTMFRTVAEHAVGKPTQSVAVSGRLTLEELVARSKEVDT